LILESGNNASPEKREFVLADGERLVGIKSHLYNGPNSSNSPK